MYSDEKIRKIAYDKVVELLLGDNDSISLMSEAVAEALWEEFGLIITQNDSGYLVEMIYDDALEQVREMNQNVEELYCTREESWRDAVAGRW